MNVYVATAGTRVGTRQGRLEVRKEEELVQDYPMTSVDCITLYTGVNITPAVIQEFSDSGKNIFWVNTLGRTYACITSPGSENVLRRKKQYLLTDNSDFCLEMSKRFVAAKLSNQLEMLSIWLKENLHEETEDEFLRLSEKVQNARTPEELLGLEGTAARLYFQTIAMIIPKEFGFYRRTRQPPRDMFSSALGFAYSLLHNEYVAALQGAGLDPNVGVMHKLRGSHFALASDMMEELRPVLADRLVLQLINEGLLTPADFETQAGGAVYLERKSSKKIIAAYEALLREDTGLTKNCGFGSDWKATINIQVHKVVRAIEAGDSSLYTAVQF